MPEVPELMATWGELPPLPDVPATMLTAKWAPLPKLAPPDLALRARVQPFALPSSILSRLQPPPVAASVMRAQPKVASDAVTVTSKQAAAETPVPQNVQNIMVLGYDNHSIVQDLTSPTGKLRAANGRVAFMGAY
jgi:hypothetical protein